MKQKYVKFTAALLSLALLFSVLAVPASAEISTWATHTTDLYEVGDGTAVLWFIENALQSSKMEGVKTTKSIRKEVTSGRVALGELHSYTGYIWCDDIDTWTYAGLSNTESGTIYWYNESGYNAWIDALKDEKISVDWSNGYVTAYPGTSNAKVIKPCSVGTDGDAGFSLTAGDLVLGRGKTALLLACGAAAFVVAVKLYDDPTILENAKQKAQDFLGGITDTVQGWLSHDAPAEETAASSDAAQPAQSDTPAA